MAGVIDRVRGRRVSLGGTLGCDERGIIRNEPMLRPRLEGAGEERERALGERRYHPKLVRQLSVDDASELEAAPSRS